MNDEDLLGYFEIHSRTERALFHRDQVARLLELAGEPTEPNRMHEWLAVHSETADPLVKRARANLDRVQLKAEINEARYILISGFVPESERDQAACAMSLRELAHRAYDHHDFENAALRTDLTDALEALRWCSGAKDFQDGEHASSGYNKIVHPVIVRLRDRLSGDGK